MWFQDVRTLKEGLEFNGITLHLTSCQHGCILSRKELNDYVKKINIQMLKSHWMEKQSNYKYLFFNYIK
ncbi:hypothetical protein DDB_G0275531 [Dictyostelium discoideum AX4]|uniref:Putative uncharacterized protein DDB_G0275531 n=1 Tax=Dictyostelium discoideum TaxID=44689 RepID=Y7209_DICDI|nr:hypothetical protein DDB_G0275531 [Dictyostelium discoideum AX4]Q86H59.1 RecName: Full=Putative uncharacterized protein DDB_G0275531 [Dictyostelium discoideum]EAL69516.1 hypothetical protein DDB_G0275531 [Dictyostelium discoideum AX4]|eukprot:XP_643554.1 hypothetical protein DDB_G0275531 [Dictyostelium discoideum AX4]